MKQQLKNHIGAKHERVTYNCKQCDYKEKNETAIETSHWSKS